MIEVVAEAGRARAVRQQVAEARGGRVSSPFGGNAYGRVRFAVGSQEFTLLEGDSLHFAGEVPHRWENVGDDTAELVWVALRNG